MSIDLDRVPFLSIINFSTTCGIGRNGASNINMAAMMRMEYGILSRKFSIFFDLTNIHLINFGCAIKSLFLGVISSGMVRVITAYPLALNSAALVTSMASGPSSHPPKPPKSPIFVSWQQGSTASLAPAFTAASIIVSVRGAAGVN